jgi:small subunit ribosomal protein S8
MINTLSIDYLIRLKNSSLAGNKSVIAPNSKFVRSLSDLLIKNGLLTSYEVVDDKKSIKAVLAYVDDQPLISQVKLFSKPGRRWYENSNALPWGQSSTSLIIISTSKGLLTQRQAQKQGIGGEIIAEIN